MLCLGYRGNMIKDYFLNYEAMNNDFTIRLGKNARIEYNGHHAEQDFKVTLADTGLDTMTGGRVKRIQRYVKDETFMLTYGDGVGDIDVRAYWTSTRVTANSQPSRRHSEFAFRHVGNEFDQASQLIPGKTKNEWPSQRRLLCIQPQIFDYIGGDDVILEREPLEQLVSAVN